MLTFSQVNEKTRHLQRGTKAFKVGFPKSQTERLHPSTSNGPPLNFSDWQLEISILATFQSVSVFLPVPVKAGVWKEGFCNLNEGLHPLYSHVRTFLSFLG